MNGWKTLNSDFNLIESGLLLNATTAADYIKILKLKFKKSDFGVHGEAYDFAVDYFNSYSSPPTNELLIGKYPDLKAEAVGLEIDYCLQELKEQFVYRRTLSYMNQISSLIADDPTKAVRMLVENLDDLSLRFLDDDVSYYDDGDLTRLAKYRETKELLSSGALKIIGVPTPFKSLNLTRMGWRPGNLVSLFAKSTVGKSWIAVKSAAVASAYGFRTLLLSPEMSLEDTGYRLDVIHANMLGYKLSHKALIRGEEGIDEKAYEEVLNKVNSKRFLLSDSFKDRDITLDGIRAKVKEHRPEFLVVDGIELVTTSGNNAIWEKMKDLIYGLKYLCQTEQIPAFITAQANITVKNGHLLHVMPQIDHIAFGQTMLRASDMLFSMSKAKNTEMKRIVKIQKSRNFDNPSITNLALDWDVNYGLIKEDMNPDWDAMVGTED